MKAFISYSFEHEALVQRLSFLLRKRSQIEPYCYSDERRHGRWIDQIGSALTQTQWFILIAGKKLGQTQIQECRTYELMHPDLTTCLVVSLAPRPALSRLLTPVRRFREVDPIQLLPSSDDKALEGCARDIVTRLDLDWVGYDGLPLGYPFDYEKRIIEAYVQLARGGDAPRSIIESGSPRSWPEIESIASPVPPRANQIDPEKIGSLSKTMPRILVDARASIDGSDGSKRAAEKLGFQPTFPEARPRDRLVFPRGQDLRVGIVVSGGIAPGINAVIAGIVGRHHLYHQHSGGQRLKVKGYLDGLTGLLDGGLYADLGPSQVAGQANQGGSMLGTSRHEGLLDIDHPRERDRLLRAIVSRLDADRIDILYVIGGDGSMRAAHAIFTVARQLQADGQRDRPLSIVGVPKTMDNDILWVWQSFGFLSAVEEAKEVILRLYTEARSNPRLCVIQLFGSDSGFVVSHAALASGVCDAALIPEVRFDMPTLASHVTRVLDDRYAARQTDSTAAGPYGILVMAETAIPEDVELYLDRPDMRLDEEEKKAIRKFVRTGRRVRGQTPDALRTGGLKIVSHVLESEIRKLTSEYWRDFRVFTSEPRHLLRSMRPSGADVVFGQRLGALAVDNAVAGYTDFMISHWLTEYVLVPLPLVVLGRKRVPPEGIFWKSVLASTNQPPSLVTPSPAMLASTPRGRTHSSSRPARRSHTAPKRIARPER